MRDDYGEEVQYHGEEHQIFCRQIPAADSFLQLCSSWQAKRNCFLCGHFF